MKIGIIGATSNIAGKAYLPVYASLQGQHRFKIYSRHLEAAQAIAASYQFDSATASLEMMAETSDLIMIHAATSQHFELAQYFLKAGVPVFMDKPISENYHQVESLLELAETQHTQLITGFNRRFLPKIDQLKEIPDKQTIKVSKNLIEGRGNPQYKLYDVFIHPLDTLIYLLDDSPFSVKSTVRKDQAGNLTQAHVFLETRKSLGIASMNLVAGAYNEIFEVESPSGTHILSDLVDYQVLQGYERRVYMPNGWSSATFNRGFEFMVQSVFSAISGQESVDLRQDGIRDSHRIINELIGRLDRS